VSLDWIVLVWLRSIQSKPNQTNSVDQDGEEWLGYKIDGMIGEKSTDRLRRFRRFRIVERSAELVW